MGRADNTAAAGHNKQALPEEEARGEGPEEGQGEVNTVAQNLTLGWDWGKWTFDL